jgi:hypothetical protein
MVDISLTNSIVEHASLSVTISGTLYSLETRVLKLSDSSTRAEYRVLLGDVTIKDWAEGDIRQYFGVDVYQKS